MCMLQIYSMILPFIDLRRSTFNILHDLLKKNLRQTLKKTLIQELLVISYAYARYKSIIAGKPEVDLTSFQW